MSDIRAWATHPVTEKFFKRLEELIDEEHRKMESLDTEGNKSSISKAQGRCQAYRIVLELKQSDSLLI